ncbi:MAG: PP2C family protein-serine/threonine phosphatase [Planctomycetota bacterium]
MEQRDIPWFSEDDVRYYSQFLSGPAKDAHENFKTLLATVSEVLGQTDLDALLKKLVQHALHSTQSERGILLLAQNDKLHVRVALDREGRDLGTKPPMARSVPEAVYRDGQPIIRSVSGEHEVLDLSQSAASLRLRQVMCAPLRARGKALGTIYVDSTLRRQPHTAADLKLFHAQAGLMGMAVENHRLFQEAFDARDVQRQLAVARDIQQRLYPKSPWVVGGAEFAGLSEISAQVGGDYFDFLPLNGGRAALGIGDVAGHGIAPALIMSDVRARLRSLLQTQGTLAGVYGILNQALCAELAEGMFVALFVAAYDPEQRVLEYQNGGHVAPLLYSSRADHVRRIEPNAPALGLFDDISAGPCPSLKVDKDDCLVCFTDGVADRPDPDGDLYGLERLEGVIRRAARAGATATDIAAEIRADSETHAHGRGLRDDFTLLVVKF